MIIAHQQYNPRFVMLGNLEKNLSRYLVSN